MKINLNKKSSIDRLIFVITIWFLSRLFIIIAIQFFAPLLPISILQDSSSKFLPTTSWQLFSHWDGTHYLDIATTGYNYNDEQWKFTISFFPLFPFLIYLGTILGFSPEIAGILINNLSFLGAVFLLYCWVENQYDITSARWTTAVLVWCPFSLFGTVIYSEGLFLLVSTAALRAFDNGKYSQAALWGGMATATRITGAALIPTFLFIAWRERKPWVAYVAGLTASGGLFIFSMYCFIRSGDPLAFVHIQKLWQPQGVGFNGMIWWELFAQELTFGKGLSTAFRALTKIVMFFGGAYLLWYSRTKLRPVVVAFSFCYISLILASGATLSIDRFAYGNISLSIAFGFLLARHPRWGYLTIGLFALLLFYFSLRFTCRLFVG
jgi:Gpi18-like mannosyltransferase